MTTDDKNKQPNMFETEDANDHGAPFQSHGAEDDFADLGHDIPSGTRADAIDDIDLSDIDALNEIDVDLSHEDDDDDLDDIDGDAGDDFIFDAENKRARGGLVKKMAAPLAVLLLATAAGGYIIMNPDIVSKFINGDAPAVQRGAAMNMPGEMPEMPAGSAPFDQAGYQPPEQHHVMTPMPPAEESSEAMVAPDSFEPVQNDIAHSGFGDAQVPRSPFADEADDMNAPVTAAVDAHVPADISVDTAWDENSAQSEVAVNMAAAETAVPEITPVAPAADPVIAAPPVVNESEIVEMGSADDIGAVQAVSADSVRMPDLPPPSPVAAPVAPPAAQTPPPSPAPVANNTPAAPSYDGGAQQGVAAAAPAARANDNRRDVYYDAQANLPSGTMTKDTMRTADPTLEPGQRLVIARRDHSQSSQEAQVEAASRALKLQRYDAALDMYEKLYEKNKRDHRILMGLAYAQQQTGRPESAIQTYEQLLDLNPRNADAMVNMLGLLRQQYPEVALRRLLDLQDRHPSNAGISAQIGLTQAELGHHDDAIRYMQIAASLEPRNAQHMFNLAVIADRKGAVTDAIRFYEQALEVDAIHGGSGTIPRESIYDRLSRLRR